MARDLVFGEAGYIPGRVPRALQVDLENPTRGFTETQNPEREAGPLKGPALLLNQIVSLPPVPRSSPERVYQLLNTLKRTAPTTTAMRTATRVSAATGIKTTRAALPVVVS